MDKGRESKRFGEHKFIVYGLMSILFITFTLENFDAPWLVMPVSGIITAGLVLFDVFELYYKRYLKHLIFILVPMVTLMGIHSRNVHYRFFFYLLLYYLFFHYALRLAIPTMVAIFSINVTIFILITNDNVASKIGFIMNEGVLFILVALISNLLQRVLAQNEYMADAGEKLIIQNIKLDSAMDDLKMAYKKSEEAAILKERNQMAREVHDTVGHTLATVLVELEAAKIIEQEDKKRAKEKIEGAITQVRSGLGQLRKCVDALRDQKHEDIEAELCLLIENLEKNTGTAFFIEMDHFKAYSRPLQRVIFAMIREGITNGIKHGGATAFVIKCITNKKTVRFEMSDNGRGTTVFEKGFGLKSVLSSVKELGGTVSFESSINEGFQITAEFLIL